LFVVITARVMDFFAALNHLFATLISIPGPPTVISSLPGYADAAGAYMSGLNPWVPLSLTTLLLTAWGVSLVAAFAIKIVRICASFATFGGGSAA